LNQCRLRLDFLDLSKSLVKEELSLQSCFCWQLALTRIANNPWEGQHFHTAVLYNKPDAVELLLKARADPNSVSSAGATPLQLPVGNGNVDIITSLLPHGANPNACDSQGYTPLYSKWVNLQQLNRFCNVDLQEGNTLLHYAARHGIIEVVELLLKGGENPNAVDRFKETPLHCTAACWVAEPEESAVIVETLFRNGGNLKTKTWSGDSIAYCRECKRHSSSESVVCPGRRC
jgi:hypothetical protein